MLLMSDAIRELINQKASMHEIRAQAMRDGLRTLLHDGIEKIKQGVISLEDLLVMIGLK